MQQEGSLITGRGNTRAGAAVKKVPRNILSVETIIKGRDVGPQAEARWHAVRRWQACLTRRASMRFAMVKQAAFREGDVKHLMGKPRQAAPPQEITDSMPEIQTPQNRGGGRI